MIYGEKKIVEANDMESAIKFLEQGEAAVKIVVGGSAYIITKEDQYSVVDDGSSVIK